MGHCLKYWQMTYT